MTLINALVKLRMSLELILGPMFAGKTSALQAIIRRHEALGIKCVVYKPISDTRYGTDYYMYNHDQSKIRAVPIQYLSKQVRYRDYLDSKLIVIEEGQFFEDLYKFVLKAVEDDQKTVVVGGLDGDCFRKPFGQILQLIPLADRVTKLTALCKGCADGTVAMFTFRKSKSKKTVELGGSDAYMPLCRKHYLEFTGSHAPESLWDFNEPEPLDRDVPQPTIQATLEVPPIVNPPKQTKWGICRKLQSA